VRAWLLPAVALVALVLAPTLAAAPAAPDIIHGAGMVSWFQVFAFGLALEGAGHDFVDVCGDCFVRFTTTSGAFTVVDASNAQLVRELTPGLYEIREYRGLFAFTQEEPGAFVVQMHGAGKVIRLG